MDMFVIRSVVRGPMVQRQKTDKIDKALHKTKKPLIIGDTVLVIGTLMVADGVAIGTKYLSVTAIPGPIIGLLYGLVVLSLGISKAIMTATALKTPALTK